MVAVVVDRSGSQTLGERAAMTTRVREELERRLGAMPDVETRFVDTADGEGDDGTRLFAALGRALADVPPDRLAGVVMVTDGVVHDPPGGCRRTRLSGASPRADHRPPERARPPHRADRGAPLRHRRKGPDDPGRGVGAQRHGVRPGHGAAGRAGDRAADGPHRPALLARRSGGSRRPQRRRDRGGDAGGRADRRQQPGRRHHRGHPREASGAFGLGRAASGRADLAQPPQVGRERGPRPLHHPASAREAGRDPNQRAVAHRLSDPRALPAEDQGVRPHHLRPLRQPERAALDVFRQHRALCARGRRPDAGRRPGIRERLEPRALAPCGRAAGWTGTAASWRRRSSPRSPARASATP